MKVLAKTIPINMGQLMQQRDSVHVCDSGTRIWAGGRLSHSQLHHHFDPRGHEFQALWANQATGLTVIDLPAYYRKYIVERAPASPPEIRAIRERRQAYTVNDYWQGIYEALANDPDCTVATIPTTLWPHQERFRQQNVGSAAVRRLIVDEVGLGKTLQAGVILKTRLNQGKAGRAMIITPKAATKQCQSELLMKFAIARP